MEQLINNTHMPGHLYHILSRRMRDILSSMFSRGVGRVHVIAAGSKWQVVHQAEEQTILGDVVVRGRPKSLVFDGFSLEQSNEC